MSKFEIKKIGNLKKLITDKDYSVSSILNKMFSLKVDSWSQFKRKAMNLTGPEVKELELLKKVLTKEDAKILNKALYNKYEFNEFLERLNVSINKTTFLDIISEILVKTSEVKLIKNFYSDLSEKDLSNIERCSNFYNEKFYLHIISPTVAVEIDRDFMLFDKFIESIPPSVIVEMTTIMFNVLADYHNKKYGTNVQWLTPEEKKVWDNALKGENNEWSFLPTLISDYQKLMERSVFYHNSCFYDIVKMLNVIKTRRGRRLLNKGLEINNDTFHFLMNNGLSVFNKDVVSIFFDVKMSFNEFYNRYNFYYVKEVLDLDYKKITQGLSENNKDSNFRNLLNKSSLYLLNFTVNNLKKDENRDLLKYVNDYIYKIEKSFKERAMALNVKAFGSVVDAKMSAIVDLKNNKYFEEFYWIGPDGKNLENKVNKVEVTPLYIDELNPVEQKKVKTVMTKFYEKKDKNFVFKDSNCFIFKVNKYQILDYYLDTYNVAYSVQSIPLKIQNRIKSFRSDDTVPLWVKSFTLFQRAENMMIFFYIQDSNEKNESVFEELASKIVFDVCTMRYNVYKEAAFNLSNFDVIQESKLMKSEVTKKEVKKNVKKF